MFSYLKKKKKSKIIKESMIIKESSFFDVAWYLERYDDVRMSGMDPAEHYLLFGWKEGRLPSLGFRTDLFKNSEECPILFLEDMRSKDKEFCEEKYYCKEFCTDSNFPISAVNIRRFFGYKKITTKRTAIVAGYSKKAIISDTDIYLLKQLSKCVDNILLIMDNPLIEETELHKIEKIVTFVHASRHNMYDFGSYKIGLEYFYNTPELYNNTSELIILNDSVIGPVSDLSEIFDNMSKQKCDFWGVINSRIKILALQKDIEHIQSWFLVFKKPVFISEVFVNFFKSVTQKKDFWDVVNSYEIPLTKILCDHGFTFKSLVDWRDKVFEELYKTIGNYNQTHLPLTLLKDYKCPFIKKKLFDINSENSKQSMEPIQEALNYIKKENLELYSIIKKEYSIDEISALPIMEKLKQFDVVSFDVFDTLLIRPFVSPIDLFDFIEQTEKKSGFAKERVAAERRTREILKNHEDITIDDIYENILDEFSYLKNVELEYEKYFLKVHPENFKLYKEAVKLGKKVIVTSDMYFTKDFLKQVLVLNGYTNLDEVFVSSYYKKCKWSGNLFKEVKRKYPKQKIIHIGDNYDADIKAPQNLGLGTHFVSKYFDSFVELPLNYKYKSYLERVNGSAYSSWHLALVAYKWCFNKLNLENYFYYLGFAFAAPTVIGYCNFIYETLKNNKINTALFVSRDGYLLMKVLEKMYPNCGINFYYVYASRILNLQCFADYNNEITYIKKILAYYNVAFDNSSSFDELKKIYNDNKKYILNQANQARLEYSKYIKSLKIKDTDKIASIDCTTGAFSSQKFLSKFFGEQLRFGIYLSKFKDDYNFKNYCYSERLFTGKDDAVAILNELFITSPENSIKGIKNSKVIYGKSVDDDIRSDVVKQIHKGVFDYLSIYNKQIREFNLPISYVKDCLPLVQELTKYMSVIDQDNLNLVKHAGNIDNTDYKSIFTLILECM